jgi:hypothetical protein
MKYLFAICLFCLFISSYANPIVPKAISEFYMNNGSWALELSPFGLELTTGDSIQISNQINAIKVPVLETLSDGQCLIINSSEHPLNIDLNSAVLSVSIYNHQMGSWTEEFDSIMFTSGYPNNCLPGQSLVQYRISNSENTSYNLAVEATPTLGSHPFNITSYGTLRGHIDDIAHRPIPNAHVHRPYIYGSADGITDANGDYLMTGLEGMPQVIEVNINGNNYTTTSVNIIPTQTVVRDFYLTNYVENEDNTQDHIAPFMISANPTHAGSEIKFDLGNMANEGTSIKIYNLRGQSVMEINSTFISGVIPVTLPSNLASGIYLYRIKDVHKTLAEGKFTVIE